jgi:hypothetical protein
MCYDPDNPEFRTSAKTLEWVKRQGDEGVLKKFDDLEKAAGGDLEACAPSPRRDRKEKIKAAGIDPEKLHAILQEPGPSGEGRYDMLTGRPQQVVMLRCYDPDNPEFRTVSSTKKWIKRQGDEGVIKKFNDLEKAAGGNLQCAGFKREGKMLSEVRLIRMYVREALLTEAFTASDEKAIGVIARKEAQKLWDDKWEDKILDIVKKELKDVYKGKDFKVAVVSIIKKAQTEYFKLQWDKSRQFTRYDIN